MGTVEAKVDTWTIIHSFRFLSSQMRMNMILLVGIFFVLSFSGVQSNAWLGECGSMFIFGSNWINTAGRSAKYGNWAEFDPVSFAPNHVVTNEVEGQLRPSITPNKWRCNFWLTPDEKTGDEAALYMYFSCPRTISGFYIKNTRNNVANDRGTKKFRISSSETSNNGDWTTQLEGTLPSAINVPTNKVPTLSFPLDNGPITTRFIKFEIESFYGRGGGLQYLKAY